MAKLVRKTQKIFGVNAPQNQITTFGSIKEGSPVFSQDVGELQTTAFESGWSAAVMDDYAPYRQDRNAVDRVVTEQLAYSFQEGLPEWDSGTTYYKGSWVKGTNDAGDYIIFESQADENKGNMPTTADDTYWKEKKMGGGLPVGFFGYTLSVDVPNGGAWCDGAEYTQAMFPDFYQMLVDGKVQKTTYGDWSNSVSTYGSCGFFALDEATQKFKMPFLKDVYVKTGQAPSMFGAESLPNIKGAFYTDSIPAPEGAFYDMGVSSPYISGSTSGTKVGFDPSRSSEAYQDGAKVNPDHVVYRAFVVLYSSAVEASEAQAQEFMTALGGKANADLSNVSSNIDYVVESYQNGTEWYRVYKSGWVEQGGTIDSATTNGTLVALLKPYKNTNYDGFVQVSTDSYKLDTGFATLSLVPATKSEITLYSGRTAGAKVRWFTYGYGE